MRASLAARITLGYLLVIGAVVLAALRSERSLAQAQEVAQHLSERSIQGIRLAAELQTLMYDRSYVSNYLLSHEARFLEEAAPHHAQFQAWLSEVGWFAQSDPERGLAATIGRQYLDYTARGDEVIRLEKAGQSEQARAVFFTMKAGVEALLQSSQELFSLAEQDMESRRTAADAEITVERQRIFWLTTLGALASLVAGFFLARTVARPINKLVLRLGAAGGEAQVQLVGDEIGVLEGQVNALLDRVRRQERALQQAEKLSELGEIAAEIAHETLNPLAGARGMLQVLRRGAVPSEQLPAELTAIEGELRRVEDIVRRLMQYARPLEPRLRSAVVGDIVRGAVHSAEGHAAAAGRTVRAETVPEVAWVLDPDLIGQVLLNLLVNGLEASPPGGAVEVRTTIEGGSLAFEVRDHGSGITAEQRGRLFRPFFTTKPRGNGLGLAVSRNIVLEHGGRIEVESPADGGSRFRVTLPAGPEVGPGGLAQLGVTA